MGSLTFSIALTTGRQFLSRFCNGDEYARVRLETNGNDILLLPSKPGGQGRKLSLSTNKTDYRAFFDGGNYPWITAIKPFGATYAPTRLTDHGLLMAMPAEKDRMPIEPYIQYRPRQRHAYPPKPSLPTVPSLPTTPPPANGQLYLVMVPREMDAQFHTLLRFLKLEALRG